MLLLSLNDALTVLYHLLPSFLFMLIIGKPMIAWLKTRQWKKGATEVEIWAVREDTPESHIVKQGTPSMGGIGIVVATVLSAIAVFFVFSAQSQQVFISSFPIEMVTASSELTEWMVLSIPLILSVVLLAHGLLGFSDDYSKASRRGGLRARAKLFNQILLAAGFVAYITFLSLKFPSYYISGSFAEANYLSFVFLAFVIVAIGNAVNLTDGIDGLASGLTVQSGLMLFLAGTQENYASNYAGLTMVLLAGACLGFLCFNRYPARVFMGDTGSLAIGATLGAGAILQGAVALLPFVGFIFFVEMFSVIAQVFWFKVTKRRTGEGKRLFRRAPLHHHFEMGGWSEWRVVSTFWLINLLTSTLGLWLWHTGVLPRWP